jgi:diguanylate cyclase (GGDEF)-like protein/PAS domain S-box-containing protein
LPALIGALLRLRASERRHRRTFDHLPQTVVVVFDHDLLVRFAAGPALDPSGLSPKDIQGKFLLGQIPEVQREPLLIHYRAALRGEQRSFEYHSTRTGHDYWVRIVPLTGRRGEITGGVSVALDVSDRKLEGEPGGRALAVDAVTTATRALARSVDATSARTAVCEGAREVAAAPVAALLEPEPGGSELVAKAWAGADLSGLKLPLSGGGRAALAYARAEETFTTVADDEGGADREFMRRAGARAVLWHPVIRERAAIGVMAIAWHEEVAGVSLRVSGLIDLLGAEAAVAIGRADLLGQLEHLARTDGLTGLPNRRHWEHELPRELARAWRGEQKLCVAMLDLDHFKLYNDRRGHQAGDRLLVEAASAWREALRPYDILARYGGEEFSVIMPGCELADGVALVERLRAETPEDESCSAGIAQWDGGEPSEALVGRADAALYEAKRAGRDRTVTASPD